MAARWMHLEMIILNEVSQQETYPIRYMWDLKYDINELIYETETDSTDTENRPVVAKWERSEEGRTGSLVLAGTNHYI